MYVAAFSFVLHFVSGRKLGYFNKGGEKRFRFTHYYYYSNLYHLPDHLPLLPQPPTTVHTLLTTFPHLPSPTTTFPHLPSPTTALPPPNTAPSPHLLCTFPPPTLHLPPTYHCTFPHLPLASWCQWSYLVRASHSQVKPSPHLPLLILILA